MISLAVFWGLLHFKSASTSGRMFIYKRTLSLIDKNKLGGYGIGMFEVNYNNEQTNYFKRTAHPISEETNAAFINMPYNEYLEQATEGGVIKAILWLCFIGSFFFFRTQQRNPATNTLAAVAMAFSIMGLFNFLMQAIPVTCLLMVYTGILSGDSAIYSIRLPEQKRWRKLAIGFCFLGTAFCFAAYHINNAKAFIANRKAKALLLEDNTTEALRILAPLQAILVQSDQYAFTAAAALQRNGQSDSAILVLENIRKITSSPSVYLQLGQLYLITGKWNMAESCFERWHYMEPSRMQPQYYLMLLYNKKGQPDLAVQKARELLKMQPKVENDLSKKIKQEAETFIKYFSNINLNQ